MFANPHELYKSKEWQKLLEELKLDVNYNFKMYRNEGKLSI